MPAELLEDPAGISCVFSDGRRFRRTVTAAEPAELVRDLLAGLAALVHPHGSVDSPGALIAYTQGITDIARFMRERGAGGGAARLSRGLLAEYWMQAGGINESVTRRMLASLDSATEGGALQEGARALAAGRHFKAKPSGSPLVPYTEDEWARLRQACRDDVDEAFARHRQALKLAASGQDPRAAGWTPANKRWLLMRTGPLSDVQAGEYIGRSASWVTRIAGGIRAASDELFPGAHVVIAYRLLLGIYTGIVPDGVAGLGIGDIDWAGDSSVLLSYVKGRTAAESRTLPRRAVRLLEQWLEHSAQARGHAPADLRDRLWLYYSHVGRSRWQTAPDASTQQAWARQRGLSVDRRRIRTTFLSLRDRSRWHGSSRSAIDPNHTPAVEGDHYLTAATPAQRAALDTIIEDAQRDLLAKAHPPAVLSDEDAAELAAAYPGLVDGLNLDDAAIAGLLSGEQDVFTAACADPLSGLHGPPGKPCPARPWVCLLCPLAVFTPRHAANLLRLKAGASASVLAGADVCAAAGFRLRPRGHAAMFDDDIWNFGDIEGLSVQMSRPASTRLDFTAVSDPRWRLAVKEYIFARLAPGHPEIAVLPRAFRVPLGLPSCLRRLSEAARWMNWLTAQQVPSLGGVTQDHCDRYLAERRLRKDAAGTVVGTMEESGTRAAAAAVIELASYGELLSADRYRDGFTPWNGRSSSQVAGMHPPTENKTPAVSQEILRPLLAAALYTATTIAPHLVTLAPQVQQRRREDAQLSDAAPDPGLVKEALRRHARDGEPLEAVQDATARARLHQGWSPDDPLLSVSLTALAREAGARRIRPPALAAIRPLIEQAVAAVGVAKPWGRQAEHVPLAGDAGTTPWTLPLDERGIRDLTGYAHTACLLLTAALTGMRESELMELRHGCRSTSRHGDGMTRYRLKSKLVKGQPLGGTSEEWVVIETVYDAVGMAEQLSRLIGIPADLVFGRFNFEIRCLWFRNWANGPAGQRLGLAPIPDGAVNLRMLRRTLARELAYRPGGLLAAKFALKHVSVATTEGYAARPGGAQGKLLAEVAEDEAGRNLQIVLAEFRNYQDGIMPAGPGARELTEFFAGIDKDLAGYETAAPRVVASDQHVLNLLSKRAQVLHLATANYCWFTDPSRALCLKMAGTPAAGKPLAGMCDSARCPQATHHPCHRPVWADAVTSTTAFIGSLGRTRTAERARLQAELDRAQRVLDSIDAATAEAGKQGDDADQP